MLPACQVPALGGGFGERLGLVLAGAAASHPSCGTHTGLAWAELGFAA